MEKERYSNYPLSISAILGLIEANEKNQTTQITYE
jgi:hypothetical protein